MIKKLIHVQGDHPTFARIDKYMSDENSVKKLIEELQKFNYENIKINGKGVK